MRIAGRLDRTEFAAIIDSQHDQIGASVGLLTLYGLADWSGPRMIGAWGWANGVLDTAGLAFGVPHEPAPWAEIISSGRPAEVWVAERFLAESMGTEQPPDPSGELAVEVDGATQTFQYWPGESVWYAATAELAIAAHGIDPAEIRLVPVTDVEPYLAATREHILARYDAANGR
jgi:hypothetical protein